MVLYGDLTHVKCNTGVKTVINSISYIFSLPCYTLNGVVDYIKRVKKYCTNICVYRAEEIVILLSAHRVTYSVKTLKYHYVKQYAL